MAKKKKAEAAPAPKRGGSDAIRAKGWKSILVPVSPDLHQRLRRAAALAGVPANQFIREAAEERADRVIAEFKAAPPTA